MSQDFSKFPSTPHLLWLGTSEARKDKILTKSEAATFLDGPVIIEEKVDGANIGISFDSHGNLLIQNRGNYIEHRAKGQFAPLWPWLMARESRLFDVLEDKLALFGEWCYARHSLHYTRLPDWFLAFDIFDKRSGRFFSCLRRDEVFQSLSVAKVPKIAEGLFSLNDAVSLIGCSAFYDGPMEGVYLRRDEALWLKQRSKIVRSEFVQSIGEHWSSTPIIPNSVVSTLPND